MALKLMKNPSNSLDNLTEIDAQLDKINAEIQSKETQAIKTKEIESVQLEDFESWKNDATKFMASAMTCTSRGEARGLRHHLADLSERSRTDILFGIALNVAGDATIRNYIEELSGKIDGQISSVDKEKALKELHAKRAELDEAREKICEAIEDAGGTADRRPDSDMEIVLRWQSNGKFNRDKFQNLLDTSLETGARYSKATITLRDLKKERQDLLDLVTKAQSTAAGGLNAVQQTRAQTAAADAAELSVKIERVIRQIGELQKQWERRSKVYGAAVAFLATKGINI